jgi:hypothetical protein
MSIQTSPPLRTESVPNLPSKRKSHPVGIVLAVVWLILVIVGLSFFLRYENKPALAAAAPEQWPADSLVRLDSERPTLVMLAHPYCPCTRASIGELSLLMAHCQGRVKAVVLFLKPEGTSANWEKTDLWQSAASIPGVEVVSDPNGNEARQFHVATSGQTMLYDRLGRLLFKGGITASRGHSGDNAGRSAIVALVNQEIPDQTITAVFGCPLFNPAQECRTSEHENKK